MSARTRTTTVAAMAGALAGACWLPFGLAPIFPLAMLLALRALRRVESSAEAFRFGLAFAAARYAVAAHFLLALTQYSTLAVGIYLLAIAFVLPWGLLEGWGAYRLETRCGLPREFGFGLLYALGEWVRSIGEASLPADQLAHAFGGFPAWLGITRFVGPFGFTLIVFAVAILASRALDLRRRRAIAAAWGFGAAAIWAGLPAADLALRGAAPAGAPSIRVGVVQPAIDVREKLDRKRWPDLWQRLESLTRDASRDADLVVWPESARPGPVIWKDDAPFADPEMEALAARVGVPILYGCEIARLESGHLRALYNGAALARPDGAGAAWYGKQRLLPFVEGVPYARALGWDPGSRSADPSRRKSAITLLGRFSPGPEPTIFAVGPARIGVMICFEGQYPSLGRAYRLAGANALVVLTNDGWWGWSAFPEWHARMIGARARELDLPVIRAGNNGISSSVDRLGRTLASSRLGEVTHVRLAAELATEGPTPYARLGDLAVGFALLTIGGAVVAAVVRTRVAWWGAGIPTGEGGPR